MNDSDTRSGTVSNDEPFHVVQIYPPSHFAAKSETILSPSNYGPPPLKYDIASKKRSIASQWTVILACNAFIPLILYFSLRYTTNLSKEALVNITEITTISSVFNWPYRLWQLLRRNGERAPRDRTIFTWDAFQWQFLIDIPIVTAFCVIASMKGSLRILAMGPVVLFAMLGLQGALSCWMWKAGVRSFIRMSSLPAGSVVRPAAYGVIEDVTAVDGAGGQGYRIRLNDRFEASPPFRQLVYDVSLYLSIGFIVQTIIQIVVLAATSDEVSFAVSTGVLWVWAGASAWWGVTFAQKALKDEKLWWKQKELSRAHVQE